MEGYALVRIFMVHGDEVGPGLRFNSQLLPQFPFQTLGQILSRLLFAAREFPYALKVGAFGAPRDEKAAVLPDEACADVVVGFLLRARHRYDSLSPRPTRLRRSLR